MSCSGNCNCTSCGKSNKGNFTYVRYASNTNGLNFSKTIDEGGIERCFQSIFVSPTQLNESSEAFPLFFTNWINICDSGCGCGCTWFPYVTKDGYNKFVWVDGVYTPDNTVDFENEFTSTLEAQIGDVYTFGGVLNGNGDLLTDGKYCLEFEPDLTLFPNPNFRVTLQFGDGAGSTVVTYGPSTPPGIIKQTIIAQSGATLSNVLIIKLISPSGTPTDCPFLFKNLRLAPSECCDPIKFSIPDLRVKTKEIKDKTIKSHIDYFIANVFGPHFDIQPKVELYWDDSDLEFLNHNPEIWIFRMNNKAVRVRKNFFGINTKAFFNKKGWKHPSHNNGSKFPNSKFWGGKQDYPGGFVIRHTEFPIIPKSTWSQIAINFLEWFSLPNSGGIWSGLTSVPTIYKPMGRRDRSTFIRFRFAIVCDNITAEQGKIIGPMSDIMAVKAKELSTLSGEFMKFYTKIDQDNNYFKA